jgi:hypothetical protein
MKRFRLKITDKFEDRPRLITAYGRVKGGEVGLVLRPLDHQVLLVHITKDGARVWENHEDQVSSAWPRLKGRVRKTTMTASFVGMEASELHEDLEGKGFWLREGEDGEQITAALDVANKVAYRVVGDAPQAPSVEMPTKDAVTMIKVAQKGNRKRGPATFRGQWTGVLICDDGKPRIELRRKLASYGWLHIHSDADGWHWRFERQAKWFTDDAVNEGGPYASLVLAIDAGVAGGMGLVRQACGVRDTTRKTATEEPPAPAPVGPKPRRVTKSRTTKKPTRTPTKRSATVPTQTKASAPMTPAKADRGETQDGDEALLAAFAKALDQALAA